MTSQPNSLNLADVVESSAWDRIASDYTRVIATQLRPYAQDALRLAQLKTDERVLDVATGPGTLALEAAKITHVDALDFSPQMLQALRTRATPEELSNLTLQIGDGQDLPYSNASFDAAFSMFGLFMFPDRERGFCELARVLKPGGRALVASWQPQHTVPALMSVNIELRAEMDTPPGHAQPLADPDLFRAEMSAAGFAVEIHASVYTWESLSLEELWNDLQRAHVALGVARTQLSAARYEALLVRIWTRLLNTLGPGPQRVTMPAWIALGVLS